MVTDNDQFSTKICSFKKQNKELIPGFPDSSSALLLFKLTNLAVNLCVSISGKIRKK